MDPLFTSIIDDNLSTEQRKTKRASVSPQIKFDPSIQKQEITLSFSAISSGT